ncbi:MAG: NAD-dependent epimerase/dehydratase family protein [Myxococcota bacterium]
MNLLLTGASSFVGAHVAMRLATHHKVWGCTFSTPLAYSGVQPLRIDLRKKRAVEYLNSLSIDAVVHIACKIKARPKENESPAEAGRRENRQMMNTILALGKPIVYASSTVVHWTREIPYRFSRLEDEQRLVESGLPYAILRPSAPYGPRLLQHRPGHQESFHTLANWVQYAPVVPVIGSGQYRRQPVHVSDFASAICALLHKPLPNKAFDVGGETAHSFNELIAIMKSHCRRNPIRLSLPKWAVVRLATHLPDFDPSLLDAVDEDEVADSRLLSDLTQVHFRGFQAGVPDVFR